MNTGMWGSPSEGVWQQCFFEVDTNKVSGRIAERKWHWWHVRDNCSTPQKTTWKKKKL
jgi:hypothetical protein